MTALLVALGAAVGAPTRFLVAQRLRGLRATLLVNVAGSALLGLLAHPGASTYAFVGVGFCGALTTFSTFAVEVAEARSWRYLLGSAGACLLAAAVTRYAAG